jgi:DNA replication and repair protein RecF
VLVDAVLMRNFRGYAMDEATFGPGLTLVTGPNGAGKTNLMEAVYFGCTGRSCRTNTEREVVRFGQSTTRVVVRTHDDDGAHEIAVGFAPGEPKRLRIDGAPTDRLIPGVQRPLISVFLPDRLELIKGVPGLRRAHLDQFVAALWPARASARRAYAQSLAQRNALIVRIRQGDAGRATLHAWDEQLARTALELMTHRRAAVQELAAPFRRWCGELGLDGDATLSYRPRSRAADVETLRSELRERVDGDLERGFSGHGPHRDDLVLDRHGRSLRSYGSQGQQRMALLALLLAERDMLSAHRAGPPLMLLDDVLSELDPQRREALIALLRTGPGQAVITATDLDGIPGADEAEVTRLSIADGEIRAGALA